MLSCCPLQGLSRPVIRHLELHHNHIALLQHWSNTVVGLNHITTTTSLELYHHTAHPDISTCTTSSWTWTSIT